MTRDEICAALAPFLKVHQDTMTGDLIADLLALAWPDNPPAPLMGVAAPLRRIVNDLDVILKGWDWVARQNDPAAVAYREGARAVRAALALIDGGRP